MNALILAMFAAGAFGVAYFTYGRFLAARIFRIRPDMGLNVWLLTEGLIVLRGIVGGNKVARRSR